MLRQESRSIVGASIVRNYFRGDVDPNGALTQVNSLASAAIPNLPPGTLPPVVLPFDPTSTTPVCIVALDSTDRSTESVLYDVGRYEVRNMIMAHPGRGRAGRLRRQDPRGDGLPRPQQAAGPRALAARRDERDGQLQPLPADRRRQVRRAATTPSTRTRCTASSSSMGDIPLRTAATATRRSSATWHAQGRRLHPDQHRPGQRPQAGLHPGLPPARREHPERGRHAQGSVPDMVSAG